MSRLASWSALCLPIFVFAACSADSDGADDGARPGGKADDPVPAATGLDSRPVNATCLAPDRPSSSSSITHRRAWDNLSFSQPVVMLQPPQSDRWFLVEKRGVIWSFSDNEGTTQRTVVLDHRSNVDSGPNEAGMLGLAFHPDFADNGTAFLSYTLTSQGQLFSLISRIESTDGGETLDPDTEEQVLFVQQPFSNHNGGGIAFGPDGFLYIGFGDGGLANDPNENGQNKSTRLGALLRIDVDGVSPFGIPSDNPFANGAGLPEIYAYGLRNPWRFSFDQQSGQLWLADVGQDEYEEVNIIESGGNYGWNRKEGFECFADPFPCNTGVIDPVLVYDHDNNDRSITGGHVYRGGAIPALDGTYLFGDFVSGRLWGRTPGGQTPLLLNTGANISAFAQDHDGEVYFLSYGNGTIRKIVPDGVGGGDFPTRLSDTGCFDPDDPKQPLSGLIPYDVNAPLWSDGAAKQRWMALPAGEQIHIDADGELEYPIGTVLVKQFWLAGQRIETRLMVRHDDGGWAGYAYRWNSSQTEAHLTNERETLSVGGQSWTIPSRSDCMSCHTAAAGFVLGPEVAQLNGDMVYESSGRISNQIDTLIHIDLFDNPPLSTSDLAQLPRYNDSSASVEDRARAYLSSNCSNCHRPSGPGLGGLDLRHHRSLADTNVCEKLPETGSFGISGARIVAPGDVNKSLLALRMNTLGSARMPTLGSAIVDSDGVGLMVDWINGMDGCDGSGGGGGGGGGTGGSSWTGLSETGTVFQNEEHRFETPVVPAGVYRFEITGSGDADLYVRAGSLPTTSEYNCRPFLDGSTESCLLQLESPDAFHIMVRGFAQTSAYALEARPEN